MDNNHNHNQLEIGQVIFCIAKDTGALYPVQVIEEVVHKSITGTKKTYTVRLDLFDENDGVVTKIVSLDSLQDEWFPTLIAAKTHMLQQASLFVDSMAENAEKLAMLSFGDEIVKQQGPSNETTQAHAATSIRKKPVVTMPDGSKIELDQDEK